MAIETIDNFNIFVGRNIDSRYGPYANVAEATGSIDSIFRYKGLTVLITGSGQNIEYWFNPTIANTDLVPKGAAVSLSGTDTQVVFFSGSTQISGSPNITYNYTNNHFFVTGSATLSGSTYLPGINDTSQQFVLTYNPVGGQVYYTSSNALSAVSTPLNIEDEGILVVGSPTFINFTGSGVFATASGAGVDVYIPKTPPGGLNTQIQFNSGSEFSGSGRFTFDYTNNNVILTGSLLVTQSHISTVDYIDFTKLALTSLPAHNEGRLHWYDDTKTLQIDTDKNDFMIEVGHQNVVRVYNDTGVDIPLGKVVRISGSQGNQPTIVTASYTDDQSSASTLGFTATLIAGSGGNRHGYVITNGILRNVNTVGYSVGTQLYLSSSGNFTSIPPDAPLHEVRLGKVIVSNATTGVIYVDVMNGYELTELHDVRTTTYNDGDLLVHSSSLWINSKQLTGSYGLTGSLTTSGSITLTGSLFVSGAISASFGPNTVGFYGTASWAQNALTASFITASNVWGPFGSSSVASASFASSSISASYAETASLAYTASFITASNVWGPFGSSSVASASFASSSVSASYAETASYAFYALTASYVSGAIGTPAPSDTYIQFNQNGVFGGDAGFRYIYSSSSLEHGSLNTASGQFSHAQGGGTVALGTYSHTEGTTTYTGFVNAYSASISSGVVTLWDTYPDLSGDFLPGDYIVYKGIGNEPYIAVVDSATYSSPNTIITLTDLSINVASTIIGNANKNVASWTGDQTSLTEFGFSSHAEGTFTYAIGVISHAEGRDTAAFKEGSNTKGRGTVAVGTYQSVTGTYNALNTSSYSFIIGDGAGDTNRHNLLFTSKSWFEVSASNVFFQGLPTSSETHILIYNTSSGQVYYTASSAIGGGGSGTPAPSDTYIQYNQGGAFGAEQYLRYIYASNSLWHGDSHTIVGNYSFAQGQGIRAIGSYSQGSGYFTQAGYRAFATVGVVNGIVTMSGDFTSQFAGNAVLLGGTTGNYYTYNNTNYDSGLDKFYIFLDDTSVQTGTRIADTNNLNSSHPSASYNLGSFTFAQGFQTIAAGQASRAEGVGTKALGINSHAEGAYTKAIGPNSHAEGTYTEAIGDYSHAEGLNTIALGDYSHAQGAYTVASGSYQFVAGQYNKGITSSSAFIIGAGTNSSNRKNILTVLPGTSQVIISASSTTIDNKALIGISTAPAQYTTANITTISGVNNVCTVSTSSYDGAFFDYVLIEGNNARAGQVMSVWNNGEIKYTETTTTDIGSTTDFIFSVSLAGSLARLQCTTTTAGAIIKTIIKSI